MLQTTRFSEFIFIPYWDVIICSYLYYFQVCMYLRLQRINKSPINLILLSSTDSFDQINQRLIINYTIWHSISILSIDMIYFRKAVRVGRPAAWLSWYMFIFNYVFDYDFKPSITLLMMLGRCYRFKSSREFTNTIHVYCINL